MDLDPGCLPKVEKKYSSEEGKKEEKSFQHKKFFPLKKRSDFLFVRKNGLSFSSKYLIFNYLEKGVSPSRIGFTVSKKLGNAVNRNYIKRLLRACISSNFQLIPENYYIEIIPKKGAVESKFKNLEKDIKKFLMKLKI